MDMSQAARVILPLPNFLFGLLPPPQMHHPKGNYLAILQLFLDIRRFFFDNFKKHSSVFPCILSQIWGDKFRKGGIGVQWRLADLVDSTSMGR